MPPSLPIISSNVISSSYVQPVQKGSNINIAKKKACFKPHQSKSSRSLVTVVLWKGIARGEFVPEKELLK